MFSHRCVTILSLSLVLMFAAFASSGAPAAPVGAFRTLYSFAGPEGGFPTCGLVVGADGDLYGTTPDGGDNDHGAIYRLDTAGTFQSLHLFNGPADGATPVCQLINGPGGLLFGTTGGGGDNNAGTIYTITSTGGLHTLHMFLGNTECQGSAGLVNGPAGIFYGVSTGGGVNGLGAVFAATPTGDVTVIYSFTGGPDGQSPVAGLAVGPDDALYGVTNRGAANSNGGTIFRITPDGHFSTLHTFDPQSESDPSSLASGPDGALYGTLKTAGADGAGAVYRITPAGDFRFVHVFNGKDGMAPNGPLVMGCSGAFYGVTYNGGPDTNGTVYRITPSGQFSVAHNFTSGEGHNPSGALVLDTADGALYGVTYDGGAHDQGTVFRLQAANLPMIDSASAGSQPGTVLVAGTGFEPGAVVYWSGKPLTTRQVSKGVLEADFDGAAAGPGELTVALPCGMRSLPFDYTSK